jgi:hypothetical protein
MNNTKFFNSINININNKKNKFILKNIINKNIKKNLIKMKKYNMVNFYTLNNKVNVNLKFYENKIVFKKLKNNKWN